MKTFIHAGSSGCIRASSALRLFFLTGMTALGLAGCTPAERTAFPTATAPEKSTVNQVIEGFTGKTSVDAGQRAKAQIKDINETRKESFEEF
ncbi:MAG: hypothetical protein FJ222_00205 [Lentisphaerae bacterium]|nr:hypothetical protein [Lentisphaerota bacterium]